MNLNKLADAANVALAKISAFAASNGTTPTLESIRNQMKYIRDAAANGKNPNLELAPGQLFTYAILASREFASPEELEVKAALDSVSALLDG
jgi:hypothetical protein